MSRQYRRTGWILRACLAAAPFLFSASARAQSVQVFINNTFVSAESNCTTVAGPPPKTTCVIGNNPNTGVISNDPHIEFDQDPGLNCVVPALPTDVGYLPGVVAKNICNSRVYLCAQIGAINGTTDPIAIDELNFELFKYGPGSNATDPATAPPIRTFFVDGVQPITAGGGQKYSPSNGTDAHCVLWDGFYNVEGEFGKTNGQFGFRATVKTNQSGSGTNINITHTRAYPAGTTQDSGGAIVSQKSITVDVTNVHVVRSTPAVIGQITGVAAEPYSFTYRLSKDALMDISIYRSTAPHEQLRGILLRQPRIGEGVPQGTMQNGDSWDGRDDFGNILPAGNYLVGFQAISHDPYTSGTIGDLSIPTVREIALDPLQITDVRVQPLQGGATSLAVLSYMLTEPATTYIDIYPPGTQFCAALTAVSDVLLDAPPPVKNFQASLGGCTVAGAAVVPVQPLRSISEQKVSRSSVISFWDGRDSVGNLVGDGDYVFVMYASLPSQMGTIYNGNPGDKRIWTDTAKNGYIPVIRGMVGITQVSPTSTVIGSSPAITGLNPFTFRYQLSRDAVVSLKIFDVSGSSLVKTIVNNEIRPGLFNNSESWTDGANDAGQVVSSGTYLVQLTAADPLFPTKVSTTTAQFPVNLMRITDVAITPLLSGASDQVTLNYQLSQPMFVAWNIYPAGSYVSNTSWPPCPGQSPPGSCSDGLVKTSGGLNASPVVSFHGLRPGRMRISEFWDGRDAGGLYVPDGNYVYTLTAQSTTTPKYFPTDRVYGNITVARGGIQFTSFVVNPDVPVLYNSSNTITLHPYTISYGLTRQSSVTVQILSSVGNSVIRTVVSGSVRQGGILQTDVWDGRDSNGNFPPTGFYLVRAVAEDVASVLTSGSTAQLTISYDPLRIYDLAVAPLRSDTGNAMISYQVSETMKVAIKIYKPGTIFGPSGNASPPESTSLVRRIVGIRPPRTQIQETWDGRDFRGSLMPDGNYKFKVVGSTNPAAIDDITGDVNIQTALSNDVLIDEIPVATNGSANPKADFEANTFMYPNPATGANVTFRIHAPFRAKVKMKLHNIAGELVLDKDFGEVPAAHQAGPLTYVWSKVNAGGRQVARGLYYAVIRVEDSEGGRQVLQTVKKVLIP